MPPTKSCSLQDFEVLYTIGSGSYGTCKKVKRRRDGKVFVWKEMEYGSMTETEKQMLVSEVNLLRDLKHENIVRYHERIIDKQKQILYLVMEYCEGGDLAALIKKYSREGKYADEQMVWKTLAQCASALNVCHKRKDGKSILHRDLKPANIFLDGQRNVKLGDFGLARVLHHETSFAKTFVGTPYYMSPEQMNKLSYNEKSDIWSLGCVLYEMCTNRPPFLASNQRELGLKIRMGQFSRLPSRYSPELSDVIKSMLNVDCSSRPSIEVLLAMPPVMRYVSSPSPSADAESYPAPTAPITDDASNKLLLDRIAQREQRLAIREAKLVQREAELCTAEANLRDKRMQLSKKEGQVQKLETELRRKLKQIEDTNKENDINRGYREREELLSKEVEDTDKPLTPILCRVKKVDSPSKHVSFKDRDSNALHFRDKNLGAEYDKRAELRERLEKAKLRAVQLRNAELESKLRSNRLLNIR